MPPRLGIVMVMIGCGGSSHRQALAPVLDQPTVAVVAASRTPLPPPPLPTELVEKNGYWNRLDALLHLGRIYQGRVGQCQGWEVRTRESGAWGMSGFLSRSYREEHARVDVTRELSASPDGILLHGPRSSWEYDADAPDGERTISSIRPCTSVVKTTAAHRGFVHLGTGKHLRTWYPSQEICERYEAVGPSGGGC